MANRDINTGAFKKRWNCAKDLDASKTFSSRKSFFKWFCYCYFFTSKIFSFINTVVQFQVKVTCTKFLSKLTTSGFHSWNHFLYSYSMPVTTLLNWLSVKDRCQKGSYLFNWLHFFSSTSPCMCSDFETWPKY